MFTLTFTQDQLQIIDKALSEIPFKYAAPILSEIGRQIKEQQDAQIEKLNRPEPD